MKRKLLALALSGVVLCGGALAATTSSNAINVKANIAAACVFVVAQAGPPPNQFDTPGTGQKAFGPDLNFSTITPDPGAFPITTATPATAIVRCTTGTKFTATTSSTSSPAYAMSDGLGVSAADGVHAGECGD